MSAKNAKKIRKSLGLNNKATKAIRENPDHVDINVKTKIVYFKDSMGQLVPKKATRGQTINKNKFFYRQQKKLLLKKGE